MKKINYSFLLAGALIISAIAFIILYINQNNAIEKTLENEEQESTILSEWSTENSALNNVLLQEDKSIYENNTNIYDVYISVFPTQDENGKWLDFSAFSLHQARDHTYNPTLDCNVQIVSEDKKPDLLANLNLPNGVIRVRGNSSRGDEYKSYKVKLSKEGEGFFGQYNLNINKHTEDDYKITTKLCTDLLTDVDNLFSFQTYFMRLWIRDVSLPEAEQEFVYYGLYTETEQPNKTYLERRGLPSTASIYKARDFSFQMKDVLLNIDDPNYDEEAFETSLGIREGKDHTELLEMIQAVNDTTTDFGKVFEKYFHEENYVSFMAYAMLTGSEDILNHNYLLYHPDNGEKWYFIPWDFDSNLVDLEMKDIVLPESLRGAQKLNMSVFHRRFLRLPGGIEKIKNRMEELLEGPFSEEVVSSYIQSYLPVMEKTMTKYPDVALLGEYPPNDLEAALRNIPKVIEEKYKDFVEAMKYPAPMFFMADRNENGTLTLSWDPSYSYQGNLLHYKIEVATDYKMQNIIFEKDNIIDTSYTTEETFEKGIYYIRMMIIDEKGNEQYSLEHYENLINDIFIYENGVMEAELK